MKISILLPYKENFSKKYAGAVSLFVKDVTSHSKYKKNIKIYGNTNFKSKLLKNYINLNIGKKLFQSNSKVYVEEFLKYEDSKKSDLIEIHNRPNYIKHIHKKYNSNIILYFHNDPLSMNGSRSISDRNFLLKNVHKLIFNSKWSKSRFLLGLDTNKIQKKRLTVVYQSAKKVKVNFNKKKKIISFVGKLNSAKGYDLFGKSIIKILNRHKDWSGIVLGDEPREKLNFNHKNLKILGFKNHETVLKLLNITSISVVCSRWNEPFGRTSLEASSRGCAVIISNRGGLPETSEHAIVLKKLNVQEIYSNINTLIKKESYRKSLQKKILKSFVFTHEYITKIIDEIRSNFFQLEKFNFNKISKDTKFKILHITNFNERHDARLHYNTGRRLNNGFIRSGHNVLALSDRDILKQNKNIIDVAGKRHLNDKIIRCFNNFKPDIIVLGHADNVDEDVIDYLKSKKKNLKVSQWFLDPVSKFGPDYLKNKNRLKSKNEISDSTFLTTSPSVLDFEIDNTYYIPNPCDESFETLNNYNKQCENDVFFAMSHGVHRGVLKRGKSDDRETFLNKLINKNENINFDIYGLNGIQPIWGSNFIKTIANSKMGLNLSRGKPTKYYSSDRIAQIIGNGLLTFIDRKTEYNDFFNNKEMIFYDNIDDLSEKINRYKKNDKERKKIAKNGKNKYFKYFNSNIVSQYIIDKTFEIKSNKIIWESKR